MLTARLLTAWHSRAYRFCSILRVCPMDSVIDLTRPPIARCWVLTPVLEGRRDGLEGVPKILLSGRRMSYLTLPPSKTAITLLPTPSNRPRHRFL
jgi:hypothetical protein